MGPMDGDTTMALKPTVTRTARPVSMYSARKSYGYVAELGDVRSAWLPTRDEAIADFERLALEALSYARPKVFMAPDGSAFVAYATCGTFGYVTVGADGRERGLCSTGDSFAEACESAARHAADYYAAAS